MMYTNRSTSQRESDNYLVGQAIHRFWGARRGLVWFELIRGALLLRPQRRKGQLLLPEVGVEYEGPPAAGYYVTFREPFKLLDATYVL